MRYLSLEEVLTLYQQVMQQSGGTVGIRDPGSLESALAQPQMSFGGEDLYSTLVEKASALGFSLINNHPFIDGNKRIGQAAMEVFLILNSFEINASIDEQEQVVLNAASGEIAREGLTEWLNNHLVPYKAL
jgi:death on curing protein